MQHFTYGHMEYINRVNRGANKCAHRAVTLWYEGPLGLSLGHLQLKVSLQIEPQEGDEHTEFNCKTLEGV
jgi:hypothetical protein